MVLKYFKPRIMLTAIMLKKTPLGNPIVYFKKQYQMIRPRYNYNRIIMEV